MKERRYKPPFFYGTVYETSVTANSVNEAKFSLCRCKEGINIMRKENADGKYKVMFVKSKSSYTARVVIPGSVIIDLDIHAGDCIQWERVENGVLLKKVVEL